MNQKQSASYHTTESQEMMNTPSMASALEDAKYLLRRWPAEFVESCRHDLQIAIDEWCINSNTPKHVIFDQLCKAHEAGYSSVSDLVAKIHKQYPVAKPFPSLCALLILNAMEQGDYLSLAFANAPVKEAVKLSTRRAGMRGGDSLSRVVEAYLRCNPRASNADLYAHLSVLAGSGHISFRYPEIKQCVEYLPKEGLATAKVLSYTDLVKRFYTIRKKLGIQRENSN